ncbi:MAG: hypothetical protein EVJ48_01960 [Candidatus Acidulodesulfobacterium acidiphilum]|uniref:Outer membrane protein assembly factor BamE n=1 Tax=Candidatus Acidulodesulfobacterium acidiphilum TaxID=2597224 RepID=A0A520XGG4_9DELT|nr:MAG: hypothetical protein EVJ48_01960 [Candidatus Acidulodesulfobacterium acidiphilum]
MKKTKLLLGISILAILGLSLSGCGFYNVKGQSSAGFIKSKNVKSIKGVSKNYILAKYGVPSRKYNSNGYRNWSYCGKYTTNTTYLTFFHTKNVKSRCVIFKFRGNKVSIVSVKIYGKKNNVNTKTIKKNDNNVNKDNNNAKLDIAKSANN